MVQVQAQIEERFQHGGSQELRLRAPVLARRLKPGQAILVRAGWGLDPYLRRTYYPQAISDEAFTLHLPAGGDRGDAWLRVLPLGSRIDCRGPVGIGFYLPDSIQHLLCLGFGDQAGALLPLIWQAARRQIAVTLAIEATSSSQTPSPRQLPLSVEYHRFIRGQKQHLSAALPDLLGWADQVAAVAPMPFYDHLAELIRQHRILLPPQFAQVLVPVSFLCGSGVCLGCATDIAGGRRRVCLRGPVFDLVDVIR